MATSSISATLSLLQLTNPISSKPKPLIFSLPSTPLNPQSLNSTHSTRLSAAPEALAAVETIEPPPETLDGPESGSVEEPTGTAPLIAGSDVDKMAPKQKIRIKLKSYWVPLIEDSCKLIMEAAKNTNAKTMGPVPLPTRRRIYCVLKSPHVHKDARTHFEIRTHQRMIDILYPTAHTIDSLMQLEIPAGVDIEVKV